MRERWFTAGATVALALAAFFAGIFLSRPAAPPVKPTVTPQAIERLLGTRFTDPAGQSRTLGEWRGKPLIVNFWATWCPPCLQEMSIFSHYQERHPEIQFVGIAADTNDNVREFTAKTHHSYPLLLGSRDAFPLMAELGNMRRALPFTVGLDASGHLVHVILGGMDEAETEKLIASIAPR